MSPKKQLLVTDPIVQWSLREVPDGEDVTFQGCFILQDDDTEVVAVFTQPDAVIDAAMAMTDMGYTLKFVQMTGDMSLMEDDDVALEPDMDDQLRNLLDEGS